MAHESRIESIKCWLCDGSKARTNQMERLETGNGAFVTWICPNCGYQFDEDNFTLDEYVDRDAVLVPMTTQEMIDAINNALSYMSNCFNVISGDIVNDLAHARETLKNEIADFESNFTTPNASQSITATMPEPDPTENDVTSDEIPDLIASGYEWTCPECDALQDEIEIKPFVRCRECKEVFHTEGAEHAYR